MIVHLGRERPSIPGSTPAFAKTLRIFHTSLSEPLPDEGTFYQSGGSS